MKSSMVSLALLFPATSTPAVERADLDARIRKLTFKFAAMQRKPDKRIPADTLRQAQGIVLLDRTKAGFTEFPRHTGYTNIDESVVRAWHLLNEQKK